MGKFSEHSHPVVVAMYLVVLLSPAVLAQESQPAAGQSQPPGGEARSTETGASATQEGASTSGTTQAGTTHAGTTQAGTTQAGTSTEAASPPGFKPPKYNVLRWREDWSGLAEVERGTTGDPYDVIKYVPLTEDGEVYLSFGGQGRSRVESWQNFAFGGPGERDDAFWLNRFMLNMDAHVTKYLRGFIQGKSAFSSPRDLPGGIRSFDRDELALQNGFVDLRLPVENVGTFVLRSGRQEMLFGKQRLVGPLDWVNARRTFNGFWGIASLKDWKVTTFFSRLVIVDQFKFNKPDPQTEFWGAYAEGKVPTTALDLDLYYLALNRDTSANPGGFNGTTGREDRYTLGGRVSGGIGQTALDFEVEGAYQTGSVGSGDISAFMVASDLGYTIADFWGKPRPSIGFDYASGDGNSGGNVGTFNQLFPTQHLYQGYMDAIGRQNIIDFHTGVSVDLTEKVVAKVEGHYFLRASNEDAVYNAAGAVLRADAGGSQDVGAEIDLTLKYQINRHLMSVVGYSHFFPGDFIEDTGPSQEMDWGYLMVQYTF